MGLLRWFFSICLRIFFREIEIIGRDNIPATGPVIFVGNHNNQFVDALLLDQSVGSRIVRFLIAEKSYKRKFVGKFAKAMNSIPVARAQDNAIRGSGSITLSSDGEKIVGTGTSFKAKISAGDGLRVRGTEKIFSYFIIFIIIFIIASDDYTYIYSLSLFRLALLMSSFVLALSFLIQN